MQFAHAARRLAHVAAVALGWRPSEFWMATPAELVTALGLDRCGDEQPANGVMLKSLMERFPDEP